MDKKLLELYEESKKAMDETKDICHELKLMSARQKNELEEIKQKHRQEQKELIDNQVKNNEITAKLTNKLQKMCNDIFGENFRRFPTLYIATKKYIGGNDCTYKFFKSELQKMTGKNLKLYKFDTPFTRYETEYDMYDSYEALKRMSDVLLMPKDVAEIICDKANGIELHKYIKLIKEMPYVFLLDRVWCYDKDRNKVSIEEKIENNFCFKIDLNDFDDKKNNGIFREDEYNKNDTRFEKVVLNTFEYWYYSKKQENLLQEQAKVMEKISQIEKEREKLAQNKKDLIDARLELGKYKSIKTNDDEEVIR